MGIDSEKNIKAKRWLGYLLLNIHQIDIKLSF